MKILARLFSRLCDCLFLLPVLLVPVMFTSFLTNTIVIKEPIFQISTVYMLCTLPGLWKRFSASPCDPYIIGLVGALLALAAYLCGSYLWISHHPRSTSEGVRWLAYLSCALASMFYATDSRRVRLYVYTTGAVSAVVGIYAVLQVCNIDFFEWPLFPWEAGTIRRVCAGMGNPDFLAGYLAAILPLTVILTLIRERMERKIWGIVSLLLGTALLFTYSRGGWLATVVTLLLSASSLIYINWIREPILFRPVIRLRTAVGAIGLLLFLGILVAGYKWEEISAVLFRFSQLGEGHSVTTRPFFYRGAWEMVMKKPLFGFGLGTFALYFPLYRPKGLADYLPFKTWFVEHVHNEYLEILSETGVVGLLLYGMILFSVFSLIRRAAIKHRSRENLLLLGLGGGMVAILIHNLFTVTLRHTPSAFLFWSFLGVSAGAANRILTPSNFSAYRLPKWGMFLFLPVIPILVGHSIQHYVGDSLITAGIKKSAQADPSDTVLHNRKQLEEALVVLHKGKRLAPDIMDSYFRMGKAYYQVLDYPQAIDAFAAVNRMQTNFTSTAMNLCIAGLKQRDLLACGNDLPPTQARFPFLAQECAQAALRWIQQAIADDPGSPDYYNLQGLCYFALNQMDAAEQSFLQAMQKKSSQPEAENIQQESRYYLDLIQRLRTLQGDLRTSSQAIPLSPASGGDVKLGGMIKNSTLR